MSQDLLAQIQLSIIEGKPEDTVRLTAAALEAGTEPMDVIGRGLLPGIQVVGEKFASGEYFLPQLVIAGSAMQKAMELLRPALEQREQKLESLGTVVIGTVQGDIHEIGKSLVGILLSANGFQVYDLGVDVPTETFVSKVRETRATMVGLSALLTTTKAVQREVIEALTAAGLRSQVKVLVGGAPVSQQWADTIGADGYAQDAQAAVQLAKRLAA